MRALVLFLLIGACSSDNASQVPVEPPASERAASFLDGANARYVELVTVLQEAEWQANTRIVEGEDSRVRAQEKAAAALARWLGSPEILGGTRALLDEREALTDLQVRQLEALLYLAAPNDIERAELVDARIAAEAAQTQTLYGFAFSLDGTEITPNAIDKGLAEERDLDRRRALWEASKEVGPALRPGLERLRTLRNQTVREAGYRDFYSYEVSDYDMTADEMDAMLHRLLQELWPLYRELHTWARYELAARYGVDEVPELLPAHWLPNRWGQSWSALVEVEGLDLDGTLASKEPEWIVREAEAFYVSLGFPELPASFYEKSSLYPVPVSADYKKNTHASAWHMDLDRDVRSLMSVEADGTWFATTNHELGHIYYYLSYSTPQVPPLLRKGANRAFHEAVGTQMGMAAVQRPQLEHRGLLPADTELDETALLLQEALETVVFLPFSAGVMTRFERELYRDDLPVERWNARWWELAAHYQGIAPPAPRDERFADALTKTHINNDPAQYYDYALSTFLLFQLHEHIASEILEQDPRATRYWGNPQVGEFLRSVLQVGATRDWQVVLRDATGSDLSAEPMVRYYAPLLGWLREQNQGRTHSLPETLEAL